MPLIKGPLPAQRSVATDYDATYTFLVKELQRMKDRSVYHCFGGSFFFLCAIGTLVTFHAGCDNSENRPGPTFWMGWP